MNITFDSVKELIDKANSQNKKISEIVLTATAFDLEKSEEAVFETMAQNLMVMKESIINGLKEGIKSFSGLTGGMAAQFQAHVKKGKSISGGILSEILYNALAVSEVNACMGRIVSAPTAGSCGIMPACLIALQNHYNISDEDIIYAMLNASAIGLVISKNASISGAKGGCQAECGSAAAMTASAMTEAMGGTPDMCGNATAQALKSLMGLVCDPVAGLVEEPCVIRNASSAGIALLSADLALAGIESIIPVDEVIDAMGQVGDMLPYQLRETSLGGLAETPTGQKISKDLMSK